MRGSILDVGQAAWWCGVVDGVLGTSVISVVMWDDLKPEMIALLSTTWRAVLRGTSGHLVRWVEGTGQEKARGAHW